MLQSGQGVPRVRRAAMSRVRRLLPRPGSPTSSVTRPSGMRFGQSHSSVSRRKSLSNLAPQCCAARWKSDKPSGDEELVESSCVVEGVDSIVFEVWILDCGLWNSDCGLQRLRDIAPIEFGYTGSG